MAARKLFCFLTLFFLLGHCRRASAHPMGNFSVNHYSKITLESDRIRIRYFIDLAEIPTYQELQQAKIATTDIDPDSLAVIGYISARGAELGRGLALDVDDKPTPLRLISSGVIFPTGAGGLPTMKMGFVYEAAYPSAPSNPRPTPMNLHYADNNYPGHSGWKEIVALAAAGSLLHSSVHTADRSGELSNYPTDLLTSPPQDLEASLQVSVPVHLSQVSVEKKQPVGASQPRAVSAASARQNGAEEDPEFAPRARPWTLPGSRATCEPDASPGQSPKDAAQQLYPTDSGTAPKPVVLVYRGYHSYRSRWPPRAGACPWQDHRCRLSCGFQGYGASRVSSRYHRDRVAYRRRLCSWESSPCTPHGTSFPSNSTLGSASFPASRLRAWAAICCCAA